MIERANRKIARIDSAIIICPFLEEEGVTVVFVKGPLQTAVGEKTLTYYLS